MVIRLLYKHSGKSRQEFQCTESYVYIVYVIHYSTEPITADAFRAMSASTIKVYAVYIYTTRIYCLDARDVSLHL